MFVDCMLQSMRFPQKLWRIVNECKTGAICWGANGDTILLDYKKFQAEYLDDHRPIFKTNNITSFIRQLNLYGFRKVISHNRDPLYNPYNPHVHEFLHDNFRADRVDLLPKVCRKTSGKDKCSQHIDVAKSEISDPQFVSNPQLETNCVSRLKQCQMALTKTLEQIVEDYRAERDKELIEKKDNTRKRIKDSQNTDVSVPVLYKIEFNGVPNQKLVVEQSAKCPAFFPSKINALSDQKTISSPWPITTNDKYGLHFNIQNIH